MKGSKCGRGDKPINYDYENGVVDGEKKANEKIEQLQREVAQLTGDLILQEDMTQRESELLESERAESAALKEAVRAIHRKVLKVESGEPRQALWDLLKFAEQWSTRDPAVRRALGDIP